MKPKVFVWVACVSPVTTALLFLSTPLVTPYEIVANIDTTAGKIDYENFRRNSGTLLVIKGGLGLFGLALITLGVFKWKKRTKLEL